MSDEIKNQEQSEEFEFPLPPPTFEWLILSMSMQAEMHLGHMRAGPEEQPKQNLKAAQHAIDMLAVLQDKTKGNLSYEEERLLSNTLTELRFRYVQASQEKREG
jgi:hypothetical protein